MKIEEIDLRPVSRSSDRLVTRVVLIDRFNEIPWITVGQVALSKRNNAHQRNNWMLDAYGPEGVTDGEHDSVSVLRLPLIGLTFEQTWYGSSEFSAFVDPNDDPSFSASFRVPPPGYDPRTAEGTWTCTECEEHHLVVPDGFYLPGFDEALYEQVRGKPVLVRIGYVPSKENADG